MALDSGGGAWPSVPAGRGLRFDQHLQRVRALPNPLRPFAARVGSRLSLPVRRAIRRRPAPPVPYGALVESAGDAILTVDESATVLSCNRAGEALTGWRADEMVGRNALELLLSTDEAERVWAMVEAALESDRQLVEPIRTEVLRRGGTAWPAEFTISRLPADGGDVHMVIVRDVSQRQRLERELTHQALHDPLTGLANRALLVDRLSAALHRAERTGRWPALLFIDLDRFKVINDSLGHDVGDELLMVVAHRLSAELRASDTAARLGGDEFVVLCDELDADTADHLAQRLLAALGRPIDLTRAVAVVTASIGVVMAEPGATAETLLRDADASMYRAKADGRNQYRVFDESIRAAAVSRLSIESGLRRALEQDELELWFQPQFAVADLQPVGAEALLRWRHPARGIIEPSDFIAVAEEVGLDRAVDEWVLRSGAQAAQRWSAANRGFVVWVNLSARTLTDPGVADLVLRCLHHAGAGPANLGIEVTERALLVDLDLAATSLGRLRAAGVRIAIDDFGTGFSSLAWLERLPIDVLKIDRSFTERLAAEGDDTVVIRSVVGMAHSLGVAALAEGVETLDQLARLRQLGCDQVQGYLLSRPAPGTDLDPTVHPGLAVGGLALVEAASPSGAEAVTA